MNKLEITFGEYFEAEEYPKLNLSNLKKWENIAQFSILTAENGSGKSELLRYFFEKAKKKNIFSKLYDNFEQFDKGGFSDNIPNTSLIDDLEAYIRKCIENNQIIDYAIQLKVLLKMIQLKDLVEIVY
jgi:hypothetical protein